MIKKSIVQYLLAVHFFLHSYVSSQELECKIPSAVVYQYSAEKILNSFFRELFEETPAGYVLYGQKPIYVEGILNPEKTVPGTPAHQFSITKYLTLKHYREIAPKLNDQDYFFLESQDTFQNKEILLINRNAFFQVIRENLLLFQYKFGMEITPERLLEKLIHSEKGFRSLFEHNIALQGIVLGYGTENAISYEQGSAFLKIVTCPPMPSPPYQLPAPCRTTEEVVQRIEQTKAVQRDWEEIRKKNQDFITYCPSQKNDRLKIPFSFHKNSPNSTKLLNRYKKDQKKVDTILASKDFLLQVIRKLHGDNRKNFEWTSKYSTTLDDFFSDEEKKKLPHLVFQAICNTFPHEMSLLFFKGLQVAATQPEASLCLEEDQDLKFFDLLRSIDDTAENSFLNEILSQTNVQCLVPNKLYYRILKNGNSKQIVTQCTQTVRGQYLVKNNHEQPLIGSDFETPSEFDLKKMIPGLAHGMLGMKEGEMREIYIHPDFAYGTSSSFGDGQFIQVKITLTQLVDVSETVFPQLKPVNMTGYIPTISSCSEYCALQDRYSYFCGFNVGAHYKKVFSWIALDALLQQNHQNASPLSDEERDLLFKLDYLLYQLK